MYPKKKILALQRESLVAPGVSSLSVSARITEVLEYLEFVGEIEYAVIQENDITASKGIEWADVVIFSKHCSKRAVELSRYSNNQGTQIIYDVDDWIFSFPKYSGGQKNEKKVTYIKEIMNRSSIITVANQTLQKKLQPFIPHPVLLPNGMWIEKYISKDINLDTGTTEADPPRIVFTNADFLKMQSAKEMLLSALQVFFINHPEFILDFYGDPFPEIFSLPFLHFTNRMPYASFMQALVSGNYQFAITPLGGDEDIADREFNACKNPFKYLNYGATCVPGIYSNAQIYQESVQDGQTGILVCNDFKSWLDALELMAANHVLRQNIRATAFKDVMTNYHIRKSAEVMIKVISRM